MGSALLAQWHIQCVRERLENDVEKTDYINNVNSFVRRIWVKKVKKIEKGVSKSQESPPVNPTLEVADVENSTMTYRGATTDVIKLSIAKPNDNAIDKAISHFCTRVFELTEEGGISSKICQITDNSLLGVEPLSKLFRLYWTQGYLATFVHKKVSIFNSLANADVYTAWLRGMAVVTVATGQKENANLMKYIWAAVSKNLLPETRTPNKEDMRNSDEKMRKFGLKAEHLVSYMRKTSQRCAAQRDAGSDQLPSDYDVNLLDLVLDVLMLAFDVLTINEAIYKQWAEIVESANTKVQVAGVLAGASTGVLLTGIGLKTGIIGGSSVAASTGATAAGATGVVAGTTVVAGATGVVAGTTMVAGAEVVAGAGIAASTATATTSAAGATLASTMCSAAIMGPLALFVVSAGLFAMHLHFRNKANYQAEDLKSLSESIQGLHTHVRLVAQWLVNSSRGPAVEEEGKEMDEVRSKFHQAGLDDSCTLADFQATLDGEGEIILEKLQKMKADPTCKHIFS